MTPRTAFLSAALLMSAVLYAQDPQNSLILEKSPQLGSSVAAALSDFGSRSISQAELSLTKDNGGFVGIDGSSDSWLAGVGVDSYSRISDRIVFYGRLSYSYFTGSNMAGSVLRDMYYNPVAFVEPDFENVGKKNRELYSLDGKMSYSFNDKWSMGFGFDYESGDNVKTKDPRYRSEWMDMNVSASFWYRPSGRLALGAALLYRNTQEMVKSHIYGVTGKQYFLGIDRGGFFGTLESVEGTSGFVSPSDFQPMTNNFYGASFVLCSGLYHGEFKAFYRDGKYGLDTSTQPLYFKYNGAEASHEGAVLLDRGRSFHDFHYSAGYKLVSNDENSFKHTTSAGSNTVVTYTGSKNVLTRHDIAASLGYKCSTGIQDGRPAMQFGVDADMQMRIQRTTIYPLYRKHNRTGITLNAFADRYFYRSAGIFALSCNLRGGAGFGTAAEDGTLAASSGTRTKSFDALLNRQFEYETAPFAGAGLAFTYTRHINRKLDAYVGVKDDFASMFKAPAYLEGRFVNSAVLTIGLNL